MMRFVLAVFFLTAFSFPFFTEAIIVPAPNTGQTQSPQKLISANPILVVPKSDPRPEIAITPANCERACSMSAAGSCRAGDVTGNPRGDSQCAASRIGIVSYTQLTTFGNAGGCVDREDNNRCASGSCTTWQGKPVYGVAHRTFPFGTQMEVCNTKNGVCQIATVVERGPASYVASVTVDARAELGLALLMKCNDKVSATYKVLSVPGTTQTAEPSGPAKIALDALLAEGHITGNFGSGAGNPSGYTAVNTPYGTGYLGNPTTRPWWESGQAKGSPYASASPIPAQTARPATIATPVSSGGISAPQYNSPYTSVSGNTSAQQLQQAILPPSSPSAQALVPSAPSLGQILVSPTRVNTSGTISVSWTSLNMKTTPPCRITAAGNTIAEGKEGSKIIAASSLPQGTVRFDFICTTQNGTLFSASATTVVE